MRKISARLLDIFTFRRCSIPKCEHRAVAQISFNQYLCKLHMERIAIGRLSLEQERERRRRKNPDFLNIVESDDVLRTIEKVGFENYDPETDQPKDKGKYMHQVPRLRKKEQGDE